MSYPRPTQSDIQSRSTLGQSLIRGQSSGPRRTSASLSGIPQQQVSAQSMSDILQGTMAVRGPEDALLTINKGLSSHLDDLYSTGVSDLSIFSTVEREFVPGVSSSPDGTGGDSVSIPGVGDISYNFDYIPGFVGPDTFPPGGTLQSWGMRNFGSNKPIPGEQVASFAYWAGFRGDALVNIVAISKRESRWAPYIRATGPKDDSYGLMMINMLGTLGPDRRAKNNLSSDRDLFDPQVNMKAAFLIYTEANGFSPWKIDGDPFAETDIPEAREVVARAEQMGYFTSRPGTVTSPGSGGVPGSIAGAGGAVDIAELVYAHQIIGRHPNNWLGRGESGLARVAAALFSGGTTSGTNSLVTFRDGDKGLLYPSLINHLYFMLENGFILANFSGAIGRKHIGGDPNKRLSNHTYGGAIDISSIGHVSDGIVVQAGNNGSRASGDKLFNLLATLPKTQWANEYGWHWDVDYGTNGFSTYTDLYHYHFGFSQSNTGTLMAALRPGRSGFITPQRAI